MRFLFVCVFSARRWQRFLFGGCVCLLVVFCVAGVFAIFCDGVFFLAMCVFCDFRVCFLCVFARIPKWRAYSARFCSGEMDGKTAGHATRQWQISRGIAIAASFSGGSFGVVFVPVCRQENAVLVEAVKKRDMRTFWGRNNSNIFACKMDGKTARRLCRCGACYSCFRFCSL